MKDIKVYAHGCYVGNTGFNNHTRDFFRNLKNHLSLKVRNFTVGDSFTWPSDCPHDGEKYLTDEDRSILHKQTLWNSENIREDYEIYPSEDKNFTPDFNLVLSETNHYYFYDDYSGP